MSERRAKALRRLVQSRFTYGDVREFGPVVASFRGLLRRRFVERAVFGRVLTQKERGHA